MWNSKTVTVEEEEQNIVFLIAFFYFSVMFFAHGLLFMSAFIYFFFTIFPSERIQFYSIRAFSRSGCVEHSSSLFCLIQDYDNRFNKYAAANSVYDFFSVLILSRYLCFILVQLENIFFLFTVCYPRCFLLHLTPFSIVSLLCITKLYLFCLYSKFFSLVYRSVQFSLIALSVSTSWLSHFLFYNE